MTEQKDTGSVNDFHLYVSFHLVGDATYASQKKSLSELLTSHFGAAAAVDYEDPEGPTERELIFRVQKPVMVEAGALQEFFSKLDEVLETTKRYLPSFTQSSEATA